MQVSKNKVVSIDYRLTDNEGTLIDSSEGHEPLDYLHGIGAIVAGLEEALEGKSVGDKFEVALTPEQAYGERKDELCSEIPKEMFEDVKDIEVGMQFSIPVDEDVEGEEGLMEQFVMVTEVRDDTVVIDGNHPLAGMDLVFNVSVVEVREATEEEIDHGHAHGPNGHNHDHD